MNLKTQDEVFTIARNCRLLIRASTRVNAPTTTGGKAHRICIGRKPAWQPIQRYSCELATVTRDRHRDKTIASTDRPIDRNPPPLFRLLPATADDRASPHDGSKLTVAGLIRLEDSPYVHTVSFLSAVHQRSSTSSGRDESKDFMVPPWYESRQTGSFVRCDFLFFFFKLLC